MTECVDVAVLGAGPAGANAALGACGAGLSVALIDEQSKPGGQVWRARSPAILSAPSTPETRDGDRLRKAIDASAVRQRMETRAWAIERHAGRWLVSCLRNAAVEPVRARSLILAPGARELVQPVPGWTLPGVVGLAGATALFKQHLELPGRRTVVSGTGPLAFFVASEIRRLGGEVAAVVTPNSRTDWSGALPAMLARPDHLRRGGLWVASLMLAGVPIHWRHTVSSAQGTEHVERVRIRRVRADWTAFGEDIELTADSLCLGHGLVANTEAAQLAGLELDHVLALGGWIPHAGADGTTALDGLYLCGDGAGIRGAAAAALQGTIAGLSAAIGAGVQGLAQRRRALLARHARAARLGIAMTGLSVPRKGQLGWTTPETIMCRCESVTRAELDAEVAAGSHSANALKSGTRAGMGPCGGRYCQTVIARLIAAGAGVHEADVPPPTARPPLLPVPVAAMAEGFAYDDLPIPTAAPL